ncbi:scoloptoxin SSD20-like [Lycorma delicatula]|uniref:scoloptoxin SSD20-like n=1 Tax=Lycorma delicatula TaxID=130591 RepID=UPI003F513D3A
MDDFSVPGNVNYFGLQPSPNNFIEPGKMSLSSVSPTIIVDKDGNVTMVIGASGGTKITTAAASVITSYTWFNRTLKEAVDESRIHHRLYPVEISYEYGVIESLLRTG